MTQYLLLNRGESSTDNWDAFFALLQRGNHLIGGSALAPGEALAQGEKTPARTATLTGYLLIQAADRAEAERIARACPVHQAGGTVEIFALIKTP